MSAEKPLPDSDTNNQLFLEANKAVYSPDVPKFYSNSFIIGHGNADVFIVFRKNGQPEAVMNLSYNAAKSIAVELINSLKHFEKMTGSEIMTEKEIEQAMKDYTV